MGYIHRRSWYVKVMFMDSLLLPEVCFGLRVLLLPASVRACVCVCVCQPLDKFGQNMVNILVKIHIVLRVHWPWPSRWNLTWKTKFLIITSFYTRDVINHLRKCIVAMIESFTYLDYFTRYPRYRLFYSLNPLDMLFSILFGAVYWSRQSRVFRCLTSLFIMMKSLFLL